jgi:UDP-N-acetylglucosamine 2-epimerase
MGKSVKDKIKIVNVVGARPNFMKIAPIHEAMLSEDCIEPYLVHTGQHYDREMSELFFNHLGLPEPDDYLGIGSGAHGEQTGRVMIAFEEIVKKIEPDIVVVVGDVNSTIACGLVAVKLGICQFDDRVRSGCGQARHQARACRGWLTFIRPDHAGGNQPGLDGPDLGLSLHH